MSEGFLWNNSGFKYDTVYIPEVIYICEYLDGGLTKSGRKLRISCPLGGMDNSNTFLRTENERSVNLRIAIKEAWLFICYGKFAGFNYKEIIRKAKGNKAKSFVKQNYLFGYFLYIYWKWKYMWKT